MSNPNREKLLSIAFDEIYHNGYYASSVDKILKKANMNKGSMYHYFKSKKALGLAVIDEKISEYIENKYGKLLFLEDNYIDEMFKLFKDRENFDFRVGCKLNNLVQELSHKDDDFKKSLEKVYFRFEHIIKLVLDKAIENKEIKCDDTKKLAIFTVASIEGCLGTAKKSHDGHLFIDCISQLEIFFNQIKI